MKQTIGDYVFEAICWAAVVMLGVVLVAAICSIGMLARDTWRGSYQKPLDVHVHAERVPPPERALPSQEQAVATWEALLAAARFGYERGANDFTWPSTEIALRQAWERVMSGQESNLKTPK